MARGSFLTRARRGAGSNIELDQRHHLHAASEIHDFSIRRGVFVPIHFSDPLFPAERASDVTPSASKSVREGGKEGYA